MNEQQVIDWLIKTADNNIKRRLENDSQVRVYNARIKTAQAIKAKLKRIDSFGGVESLIAKASITGMSEKLFND